MVYVLHRQTFCHAASVGLFHLDGRLHWLRAPSWSLDFPYRDGTSPRLGAVCLVWRRFVLPIFFCTGFYISTYVHTKLHSPIPSPDCANRPRIPQTDIARSFRYVKQSFTRLLREWLLSSPLKSPIRRRGGESLIVDPHFAEQPRRRTMSANSAQ